MIAVAVSGLHQDALTRLLLSRGYGAIPPRGDSGRKGLV